MNTAKIAYNESSNDFSNSEYNNILTNTILDKDGYYDLELTDIAGNVFTDTFLVDQTPPEITGIEDGGISTEDVTIEFSDNLSGIQSAIYYKSDTKKFDNVKGQPFTNNTTFSEEGYYHIVVTDNLGNESTLDFLISSKGDTIPPEIQLSVIEVDTEKPIIAELEAYKTLSGYKLAYKARDTYSGVANVKLYIGDELYEDLSWNDEVYYRTGSYEFNLDKIAFNEKAYITVTDFYGNTMNSEKITINSDQIWSAKDLQTLSDLVNAGTTFKDKVLYLKNDIDLENKDFTPIGNHEKSFEGTLEGNGHAISNLSIHSNSEYTGLFGYNKGILQNINVIGTVTSNKSYTGGIVGYNKGTIRYCVSQVETKAKELTGGIVGQNDGALLYSFATKNVTGTNYVGGIAGKNENAITNTGNFSSVSGENYVGGVTGYNNANITNTFNKKQIAGKTNVGGITGWNASSLMCSYNIGKVTAIDESADNIGGIAGCHQGTLIKDVYNAGKINAKNNYGGVIGNNAGKVEFAYSLKDVCNQLYGSNTATILCSCLVNTIQLVDPGYVHDDGDNIDKHATFEDTLKGSGISITGHPFVTTTGTEIGALTNFALDTNHLNANNTYCLDFENVINEDSINKYSENLIYISYSNASENVEVRTSANNNIVALTNFEVEIREDLDEEIALFARKAPVSVDTNANTITKKGTIYCRDYTNDFITNKSVEINVTDDVKVEGGYYYYSPTKDFSSSTKTYFGEYKAFYETGYYKIVAYDTQGNEAIYDYFYINPNYQDTVNPTATLSCSRPSSTTLPTATYTLNIKATDNFSGVKSIELYLYDEDINSYRKYKTYNYSSAFELSKTESITIPVSECPFYGDAYIVVTDYYGNTTKSELVTINTSLIYDAYDLSKFSSMSNSDSEYEKVQNSTIHLVNNVDLQSQSWTPIGRNYHFRGTFNGNHYTVKNLYVNTTANFAGLFGYLEYGTIQDLNLTGSVTSSGNYVGSIAGYNRIAKIINCKNSASVTSTGSGASFIGGITGACECDPYADVNYGLENVWNTGNVTCNGSSVNFVGGIVGYSRNSIRYAANNGNVRLNNNTNIPVCGGICGALWNEVAGAVPVNLQYCYNTGAVYANRSNSGNQVLSSSTYCAYFAIGGMIGGANSKANLSNCYNSGNISCSSGRVNQICGATSIVNKNTSCYVSGSTNYSNIGTAKTVAEFTTSYMNSSSVSYILNDYSTAGTYFRTSSAYNDGYPYLYWQADFTASINSANSKATLSANEVVMMAMDLEEENIEQDVNLVINEEIETNEVLDKELENVDEDIIVTEDIQAEDEDVNTEAIDDTENEFELLLPIEGTNVKVSSEYGYRIHPISGEESFHTGIDLVDTQNENSEITASNSGIVSNITIDDDIWGNSVEIEHTLEDGTKLYTFYAHLKEVYVVLGEEVEKGQTIGIMGQTGMATGVHLHYEVRTASGYGNDVDPSLYL